MKKIIFILSLLFTILALGNISASAHVTVKPATVKPAAYETFAISVPNEKDSPMVKIKLIVPKELESVRPTQKTGWTVNIAKEADKITEIEWSGGKVLKDLRDDFGFSAKTPAADSKINWKAYQTFEDGNVVSWDQEPKPKAEGEAKNPYSVTEVITPKEIKAETAKNNSTDNLPFAIALISLAISTITAFFGFKKK
jgi:uncharacterized protein YcnI